MSWIVQSLIASYPTVNNFPYTGLIAYWKMDWNSNESLWLFNGTDTNVSYTTGKIWQSASFNGTNSFISTTLLSSLPTTAVSMFWWVYLNATTGCRFFWWSNTTASSKAFTPAFNLLSDNKIFWIIRNVSTWSADIQWTIALSTNTWYHIGCVWDNSNWYTSYVNWVQDGVNVSPITLGTDNFFIGCSSNNSSYTNWRIDELWIWNRRLTTTEIWYLYNSGSGITY